MPCTQSATNGLARERGSRGIPLVGSCAASASTGPSDTYGRSPERETFEGNERAMGLIVPTTIHPEREDQPLPYEWFVGIDWGSQRHQVCVLDRDRRLVGERTVDHDGARLAQLTAWLWTVSAGHPQRVAVAIEVPRGAMVEGLVERGFHVFAMNPKQLDRFRDRHSVAGAKDDRRDAFVLADAVRTDRPSFRRLQLDAPPLLRVRERSRVEETLLVEFRRSANRFREQVPRFYPQM